ncbi:N-acetyltransferase [Ectothiorhodospira haloalkaliphila]|uniref:N-acetyltransferase n=1 Tax=Ectothiorhodospira haloalkaliphila TaxID=421628 RepID=UPI001EE984A0|nr:N-acetyltransferase [Ectothiorhodospira haloalkaliphila]MCG5524340.1 N-acetyltransferase [Ectothiorhodospira haloalkaliphila]
MLNKAQGMMRRKLSRLNGMRRRDALVYVCARLLERISRIKLYRYGLYTQPIISKPLLPDGRGKKIKVYEARKGDVLLDNNISRAEGIIDKRFDLGCRCLVATVGDEFAGFLWFAATDYDEDEVRCKFVPEPQDLCVWDFDVYVSPKYRLSPVFLRLWQDAQQLLYIEGYRFSCSRISTYNTSSILAHERLGATRQATALFICAGQFQLTLSSGKPRFHCSFSDESVPTLKVAPIQK